MDRFEGVANTTFVPIAARIYVSNASLSASMTPRRSHRVARGRVVRNFGRARRALPAGCHKAGAAGIASGASPLDHVSEYRERQNPGRMRHCLRQRVSRHGSVSPCAGLVDLMDLVELEK